MIVVLDTNVIVAAVLTEGVCHDLFSLLVKNRALVSSSSLLAELERTLKRKFNVTPKTRLFLAGLQGHVRLVKPVRLTAPVCRNDPDNDVILATGVAAKADFVITGDDDLLVLKQFQGTRLISPRAFWLLLNS